MAEFKKVALIDELPPSGGMVVEVGGKKIAIFNFGETFYAIDDSCPHRGGPLSDGPIEDESVTCPWHGSVFNLKTGAIEAPPARMGVATYRVRLQGPDIEVEV